MRSIWAVFLKECLEVVRDTKTLLFMVVLPMIAVPLLLDVAVSYSSSAKTEAHTAELKFAVAGADHMPDLAKGLQGYPGFVQVPGVAADALSALVAAGELDFAVAVPDLTGAQRDGKAPVEVDLFYDNASSMSMVVVRVEQAVAQVAAERRTVSLRALGVESDSERAALVEPVRLKLRGVASEREEIGAMLGGLLPYILLVFCFLGAQFPALDLAAGEKERATLETLLLVPAPRYQVVLGKFLVVTLAGVVAAGLSVAGLAAWIGWRGDALTGNASLFVSEMGAGDLAIIAALAVPLSAMFAGLLLCLSFYAKSFKEAQAYATPLNILILLPVFVAVAPGVELDVTWALIPIANVALAMNEVVKGTLDYSLLAVVMVSCLAIAGALLALTSWWCQREEVLFRP